MDDLKPHLRADDIQSEKGGYVSGRSASAPGAFKPLILKSGSAAHNLKIELMPESVITGKVLDDAGDPAAGAQVRAVLSVVQNGRRTTVNSNSANTDSTGTYRLGGLTAGRYFFCATSRQVRYPVGGGSPSAYGESCFPGPVTGSAGSGLQIEGGQEVHADFALIRDRSACLAGGNRSPGATPPQTQARTPSFRCSDWTPTAGSTAELIPAASEKREIRFSECDARILHFEGEYSLSQEKICRPMLH
jgi:hypothetical protein